MIRWGQVEYSDDNVRRTKSAYRADLYRAALGSDAQKPDGASPLPGSSQDDRFMDGRVFDPSRMPDYVSGFEVRSGAKRAPTTEED